MDGISKLAKEKNSKWAPVMERVCFAVIGGLAGDGSGGLHMHFLDWEWQCPYMAKWEVLFSVSTDELLMNCFHCMNSGS